MIPSFSIVLASYGGEKFIAEQLQSILQQLGTDDEIIVSDDASPDGTLDVVRRFVDPRIRLLENPDRVGYVRNFERAIGQAKGRYIVFSDQDDVWLPGKLAAARAALDGTFVVAFDAIVVDDRLNVLHQSYFEHRKARSFSWLGLFLKPSIIGATLSCHHDYLRRLLPFPVNVPHDFWVAMNAAWDGQLEVIKTPYLLYRRHIEAYSPTATARTRALSVIISERIRIARAMTIRRFRLR